MSRTQDTQGQVSGPGHNCYVNGLGGVRGSGQKDRKEFGHRTQRGRDMKATECPQGLMQDLSGLTPQYAGPVNPKPCPSMGVGASGAPISTHFLTWMGHSMGVDFCENSSFYADDLALTYQLITLSV